MSKLVQIPVINKSNNPLPTYAHSGDAGLDLRANISEPITIMMGETVIIPTGIHTSIPEGYQVEIRSRSGLAAKHGVFVLNSPGTIDHGFINSWGVILTNLGKAGFLVNPGDRIAQAVLMPVYQIEWKEVESLDETERGLSGFGSSGLT